MHAKESVCHEDDHCPLIETLAFSHNELWQCPSKIALKWLIGL
jgi:hypothetical protein